MTIWGDIQSKALDFFFGSNAVTASQSQELDETKTGSSHGAFLGEIDGQRWYQTFPYQFRVNRFEDDPANPAQQFIYTLPIPPSALSIKLVPASQATATFGGVVEETSETVFWMIQLQGTTGTAISRNLGAGGIRDMGSTFGRGTKKVSSADRTSMAKKFRDTIETTGLLAGAFASIEGAALKAGNIADSLIGIKDDLTLGGVVGRVTGAMNAAFTPNLPYGKSGVNDVTNGYTEINELHRFLAAYSAFKEKFPKNYSLNFYNHKDKQKWRVVLQDFNVQKSSQNPFLYRYQMVFKGWDMSDSTEGGKKDIAAYNRFGSDGDLKPVNTLSLAKTIDQFGKLKKAHMSGLSGSNNKSVFG